MSKKALENLTESMFYVLMAFSEGAKCGTEVADYVEKKTDGAVKLGPATLYTILGKFEVEAYIKETEVVGRKRTYEITDKGLQAYRDEIARLWRCVMDAGRKEVLGDERPEITGELDGALPSLSGV